jgi:hypothetical protein
MHGLGEQIFALWHFTLLCHSGTFSDTSVNKMHQSICYLTQLKTKMARIFVV